MEPPKEVKNDEFYNRKVSLASGVLAMIYEYNYLSKNYKQVRPSMKIGMCITAGGICFYMTNMILDKITKNI